MNPKIWGWQHIVYMAVVITLAITGLILAKKFAKSERSQKIIMKCLGGALLIAIISNRISIVFKTNPPDWTWLVPDSFCGMSSLILSLSLLIGKRNNDALHFVWLIAFVGGFITFAYPDFLGQNPSFFYIPTITGLLHHTLSWIIVVTMIMFDYLHITYKKWYCTLWGFTGYLSAGAFIISVLGHGDAFSIFNPVLSGTPFTFWVIAPIYITVYAIILLICFLIDKHKIKKQSAKTKATK
ncbi:MAG: hypothetical protein E7379_03685 [Clostridiales bacterium]|nr:hypothetical protein [Clostridiales bacterium]